MKKRRWEKPALVRLSSEEARALIERGTSRRTDDTCAGSAPAMTPAAQRWLDEVYEDVRAWMPFSTFPDHLSHEPQPMSAVTLLHWTMRFLSEDYWCAGWLTGLERACAAEVAGEDVFPRPYYDGVRELLTMLRNEAGGWWQWVDAYDGAAFGGEEFVPGPLEVTLPWCGDNLGPKRTVLV